MISSFAISLAQALMLFIRPVHSKAFFSFSCSVALCLFHALYEPFKVFLCLPVNISKIGVKSATREKIDVCNLSILLQIIQIPLSPNTYRLFFLGG